MMPSERRAQALRQIKQRGACGIDELTEVLDVSRVTVHRILNDLEEQGFVKKERGGVRLIESEPAADQFAQRKAVDIDLKLEIARKALRLVIDGDAIFVDGSTTAFCFVEALSEHMPPLSLTVITNSPAVLWQLVNVPAFHVISTGGELDCRLTALGGPIAIETIGRLHFNKAFISPKAVSTDGIMTPHSTSAEVLRTVLDKNAETTLLAESPKFTRMAPLSIAPLDRIRRIVSDSKLPKETKAVYRKLGVELL